MKALVLTVFAALTFVMANAQYEKYEQKNYESFLRPASSVTGWFVELSNSASYLNSKETRLPGFTAGLVMNDNMYVGIRIKSFSCDETYLEFDNLFNEDCYLNGGYAGLYLESAVRSYKMFHLSFPLLIGGGGATYITKAMYPEIEEEFEIDFHRRELASTPFMIVEPGINLEMNVTGFLKLTAGYSYRWLYGVDIVNTNRNAFNGGSCNFGIKLGKF